MITSIVSFPVEVGTEILASSYSYKGPEAEEEREERKQNDRITAPWIQRGLLNQPFQL